MGQQEFNDVVGQTVKLRPAAIFINQDGHSLTPQQDYDWRVESNGSDGLRILFHTGHGITVPYECIGGLSQGYLLLTGQYSFKGTEASFVPFDTISGKIPKELR